MSKSHKPAGGPHSKNVTRQLYRSGAAAKAARPGGVGQIGTSIGTHVTQKRRETDYRGVAVFNGGVLPRSTLGNALAASCPAGPGAGREIHKTGSQQGLVTRANNPHGRSFDR